MYAIETNKKVYKKGNILNNVFIIKLKYRKSRYNKNNVCTGIRTKQIY